MKSGTNLAGLLQHLTFVESMWFEEIVAGGKARRGLRSMTVDASVSLRKLRAEYRAACQASNGIVAAVGDAEAPVIRSGKRHNLRWVILGVIQETARHAGHADIIRSRSTARPDDDPPPTARTPVVAGAPRYAASRPQPG